nr:unnamed protein product [Digitaria exilis]
MGAMGGEWAMSRRRSWSPGGVEIGQAMVGMESGVVYGMLKIVGNKLAPLVIKEYCSIVGVKKDLQELQGLVEEINSWLETEAGLSSMWLKDIAYDVDDIDEFHLEAEKHDTDGDGGKNIVSKYLCRKPKSFLLQCKAARKIKAIKKRYAVIVMQRTNLSAIANSLPFGHNVHGINKTTGEMPSLPIVDVAAVLGRDQEKHQIISKLVETKDQQKIKTVSILGLGGSGKTTLANLVFNDVNIIEKHFESRLWVHVSQEFDVKKLIKKLFEAIADKDPAQHALPYMTKRITAELTGKRFLLVMDDVWVESQVQWENFMVYLKSGASGSRILLTARSRIVAESLGSRDEIDLPFLSLDNSWQLFQQSLVIPAEGLGLEFVEVGKEIVKKCGGVPLAIKALAGVLRGKEWMEEWKSKRDSNLLDVEGEEHSVSWHSRDSSKARVLAKVLIDNAETIPRVIKLKNGRPMDGQGRSWLVRVFILNSQLAEQIIDDDEDDFPNNGDNNNGGNGNDVEVELVDHLANLQQGNDPPNQNGEVPQAEEEGDGEGSDNSSVNQASLGEELFIPGKAPLKTLRRSTRVNKKLNGCKNRSILEANASRSTKPSKKRKIASLEELSDKLVLPAANPKVDFPDLVDLENTDDFPEISISTIQEVATGRCGIAPSEVSSELFLQQTKLRVELDLKL